MDKTQMRDVTKSTIDAVITLIETPNPMGEDYTEFDAKLVETVGHLILHTIDPNMQTKDVERIRSMLLSIGFSSIIHAKFNEILDGNVDPMLVNQVTSLINRGLKLGVIEDGHVTGYTELLDRSRILAIRRESKDTIESLFNSFTKKMHDNTITVDDCTKMVSDVEIEHMSGGINDETYTQVVETVSRVKSVLEKRNSNDSQD